MKRRKSVCGYCVYARSIKDTPEEFQGKSIAEIPVSIMDGKIYMYYDLFIGDNADLFVGSAMSTGDDSLNVYKPVPITKIKYCPMCGRKL